MTGSIPEGLSSLRITIWAHDDQNLIRKKDLVIKNTTDTTSYEGFKDNTESFSTSNTHTGAICRRYVGEYDIETGGEEMMRSILVTLFVYRVNSYGGVDGESITVRVSLNEAKKAGGVRYDY
jgi:hypothetical protein